MADFHLKVGDTKEPINATCLDSAGAIVDLTGATVVFRMAQFGSGARKVNATATIVSAAAGTVRYQWLTADVNTAGEYEGEFRVTFSGGAIQSFPNASTISILIHQDEGA